MTFRGTRSGAKYRNFAIALALFASMLVVFAFTFIASTTRLHADSTVNNIDTWGKLAKAISDAENESGLTTIKITDDLVASSQIVIKNGNKIKIASDSAKTIYRHKGNTNFSVFKVDNGELELANNVHMTGATAESETTGPQKYHIYFKDGVGNIIYDHEFASNASGSLQDVMFGKIPRTSSDLPNSNWGINSVNDVKNTWFKYLRDLPNTSPAKHGYEFDGWEYPKSGDFWANNFQFKNATGDVTLVAKWKKAVTADVAQPLKSWAEVDKATTKDGFVLMGYVNKKNANNPVLYVYGQQKLSSPNAVDADRGLFYKFSDITSNNNVTDTKGYFKWFNSPIQNSKLRMLAVRSDNPNADAWGTLPNGQPDTLAQPFRFTSNQPINWNKKPVIKQNNYFPLNDGYVYTSIGEANVSDGFIRMWLTNEVTDDYNKVSGKRYLLRMDDNNDTGWIGVHANVTDDGNYTGVSGQSSKFWKLGFFSLDQARAIGQPDWTYTKTDTAGMAIAVHNPGGKIKKETISTEVKYTKSENDATNNVGLEHFAGKVEGETNDLGFFVQVNGAGKLKISGPASGDSGAKLENFKTVASKTNSPRDIAPVYVEGNFEMTGGAIENNEVSYLGAIDEANKSKLAVRELHNYLKSDAVPMTNTAGGVIFKGSKAVGTITGGRIKLNKGDAGGIIVTDEATVTLGEDSGDENNAGINKNIGFHHAGAALVEDGGTLYIKKTGEMFQNVTWAKGGAVWATRYGTRGYVKSDWSKWPREYPSIAAEPEPGKDGKVIMKGGNIHDNTAFVRAGAIEVESNGVELLGGNLYDNKCRSLGGAIYVEGDAPGYSFTLVIGKGYIGNNTSVRGTAGDKANPETQYSEAYINRHLDRNLVNGGLDFQNNYEIGNTEDKDFSGAWGNGGGVWLCPVGGTSLFAGEGVILDNNEAKGHGNAGASHAGNGGTDFFLSRGNGAALIQGLQDGWETQVPNEPLAVSDEEKQNGKILTGPLRLINKNTGNPKEAKDYSHGGIKIYGNWSRDGGGIASNGTVILGEAEEVNRYDAKLQIEKTWEDVDPKDKKITFKLYYKPEGSETREHLGEQYDLTLDGKSDVVEGGTPQSSDVAVETTEDINTKWLGTFIIPSQHNGNPLYLLKIVDGNNGTTKETGLDPTNMTDVAKMHAALTRRDKLQIDKWFIEIEEKATGFKVEVNPAEVDATLTNTEGSTTVNLENNVEGTNIDSFSINFTNVTFNQKFKNKPAEIEIPVNKVWKDYDDNIIMSQGVRYNSNNIDAEFKDKDGNEVWVNWPETYANYIRLRLTDDKGSFTADDSMHVAGNAGVTIQKVLAGQQNNGWSILNNKGRAEIQFDEKEYYVVQDKATGKVVLTIEASEAEGAVSGNNQSISAYVKSRAAEKTGKTESDLELADSGNKRKVYFPKLVYKVSKVDSNGNLVAYIIKELNVQGRTDDYVPSYFNSDGDPINMDATISNKETHQAMLEEGITIANDRKVNVKVTKKWTDGASEVSWPSEVNSITFKLVRIGKTNNTTNNPRLRKDKDGNFIQYRNDDGTEVPGFYEQYEDTGQQDKILTKEMWNGGTKYVEWKGLAKYDYNWFENGGANYNSRHKNRYCILETAPNGYISEIPVEYTVTSTGKDEHLMDVFNFTANNKKLTNVTATKQWSGNGNVAWPANVTFYVKRWYKFDSFGYEMNKRVLDPNALGTDASKLHVLMGTTPLYVKSDSEGYYVEKDSKKYYVEHDGYIKIENKVYGLRGGTIKKDHNNENEKVLVPAKDATGEVITAGKKATSTSNNTVTWENLPKIDENWIVDESASENKEKIQTIEYWITEEWVDGYIGSTNYNTPSNHYEFKVTNRKDNGVQVKAEKIWNDGDPSVRPKIKFELWRAVYRNNAWIPGNQGMEIWHKMEGKDYIINADTTPDGFSHTWVGLPQYGSNTQEYYLYIPREAVCIGKDSEGNDVYIYIDYPHYGKAGNENTYPSRGHLEYSYDSSKDEYTVTTYIMKPDGTVTNTKIDEKKVKTLDKNGIAYQTVPQYEQVSIPGGVDGCDYYNLKAYNNRPAIEKYVNKDVHQDLDTKSEVFEYDIMAYVPKDSTSVKIKDYLVPALEYYRPNNDVNPVVSFRTDNDHTANGSVASSTGYTSLTKNTHYTYGGGGEGKFELTINSTGVRKILESDAENGKWVKVTLKAKIKDSIDLDNLTDKQLKELGFGTIEENEPVITTITRHTGFKNTASYDLGLKSGHKFENIPSNTVTVVPPTSITVKKNVTGTLGDLTKEFVFKIHLEGLKKNNGVLAGGDTGVRDYYYSEPVNGNGVEVYNNEALTSMTYKNGFNVSGDNATKDLYVKLKDGESLTIKGLSVGARYQITEWASDHQPSYQFIYADGTQAQIKESTPRAVTAEDVQYGRPVKLSSDDRWTKATEEMVNDGKKYIIGTNVKVKDGTGKNQELTTAEEQVDPGEVIVIEYTNHRDIETETGIISDTWPWNIILLIVLVLLAYDDQMRKIKNRLRIHRISQV